MTPPSTIDGYVTVSGDVLWLTGQTNPSENGFYIKSRIGTSITRALALDTLASSASAFVRVGNGTVYADTYWNTSPDGTIALSNPGLDWLVVDIDDFVIEEDGTDDLPAWNRAHDPEQVSSRSFETAVPMSGHVLHQAKAHRSRLVEIELANRTEIRSTVDRSTPCLRIRHRTRKVVGQHREPLAALHRIESRKEEFTVHFDTPGSSRSVTVQDFLVTSAQHRWGQLLRCYDLRLSSAAVWCYIAERIATRARSSASTHTACESADSGLRARYLLRHRNLPTHCGSNRAQPIGQTRLRITTRYRRRHDSAGGTLDITVEPTTQPRGCLWPPASLARIQVLSLDTGPSTSTSSQHDTTIVYADDGRQPSHVL